MTEVERLREENARLQRAVRNQAGDALCWVKDPACPDVQALPREEFLESCRRYHAQIAPQHGVADGLPTISQLEAENATLRAQLSRVTEHLRWLQALLSKDGED
jgi:hypothetical protein